jgi:hypothetical protein
MENEEDMAEGIDVSTLVAVVQCKATRYICVKAIITVIAHFGEEFRPFIYG